MDTSTKVGIGGIVVSVLAIVGPIAWDHYKTKSEVEVRLLDATAIINRDTKPEGLEFSYKGQKLDELWRATFQIVNTGRTPIVQRDVVSPVTITLKSPIALVDAKIDDVKPKDVQATITTHTSERKVAVDFTLLNPDDSITVGVLYQFDTLRIGPKDAAMSFVVGPGNKLNFEAGARISGVPDIVVSDYTATRNKVDKVKLFIVLAGVVFAALIAVVGAFQGAAELRMRLKLKARSLVVPPGSRADVARFMAGTLSFLSMAQAMGAVAALEALPDPPEGDFVGTYHDRIVDIIDKTVKKAGSNWPSVLFLAALAGFGASYIYHTVL